MKTSATLLFAGLLVAPLCNSFGQPLITTQPESQLVSVGADVTFSVSASGLEPFSYQWRWSKTPLASETNATLTLTNVQVAQAGSYTVVVTDGFGDATTSEAAILIVDPTFTRITTGPVVTDEAHSFGCAWGDYNGDGFLDLIVGNGLGDANALYQNNGDSTFDRITTGPVPNTIGDSGGCGWADYDNDGDLDLFVANWQLPSFLFRNDGNGNFSRITAAPFSNSAESGGCAWGDYDNDGFLDLLVANVNGASAGQYLYRNDGNGSFLQVLSGPIPTSFENSVAPLWLDYDNDGRLDLFMSSSGSSSGRNLLFHNDGSGGFSLVNDVPTGPSAGGGCDWGDYDSDGDLDLFVAQYGGVSGADDFLYRNDGGGVFTQINSGIVVSNGGSSAGGVWGDYDNDGWLDLFVANYFRQGHFLYHNNRDGTFSQISSVVNKGSNPEGNVWVDYDNDGFLDLFVANGSGVGRERNFLYHNNGNGNHWLGIRCVGAASSRSGIGAKVRLRAVVGGVTRSQVREINSGNGFSGSGLRAHFGLGDATNVDIVRIEWQSGMVQELNNVAVNQFLTLTEPPRLQAMGHLPNGSFQLQLVGGVGFRYSLESSSNLNVWTPWTSVTNASRMMQLTDPAATNASRRFYRAVMQ